MRDDGEVRDFLHILAEQLEEAGVVDGVVVIVAGVHVERVLRHCTRRDVQHVRETLADRGVERLVHVRDALAAREVRGAQPRHAHARRHRGGRMLTLGLEEEQTSAERVLLPCRHRECPALAHLCGRCDRIRTGRVTRFRLDRDDDGTAVGGIEQAWVFRRGGFRVPPPAAVLWCRC
jgi:hypothetical protein